MADRQRELVEASKLAFLLDQVRMRRDYTTTATDPAHLSAEEVFWRKPAMGDTLSTTDQDRILDSFEKLDQVRMRRDYTTTATDPAHLSVVNVT